MYKFYHLDFWTAQLLHPQIPRCSTDANQPFGCLVWPHHVLRTHCLTCSTRDL